MSVCLAVVCSTFVVNKHIYIMVLFFGKEIHVLSLECGHEADGEAG